MITRKIYVKAAELVKNKRLAARDPNRIIGAKLRIDLEQSATEVEEAFIYLFRGDNPRFDEKRFSAACHPGEGK